MKIRDRTTLLRAHVDKALALAVVIAGLHGIEGQQEEVAVPVQTESTYVLKSGLGDVRGLSEGGLLKFLGLRYAQSPTGERRFLPPVPADGWDGVYDATQYRNRCVQPPQPYLGDLTGSLDEDCLFLNVVTPSVEGTGRPVLFWIHGGALVNGSANEYDGSKLAAQGDVVVVTINYRLGLLGFLDLSSFGSEFAGSNSNGFLDQIVALEWVRDNISDYGGDPNNVTIFGESAGGQSVLAILASSAADGLYHKAIAHSPGTIDDQAPPNLIDPLAAHLNTSREDLIESLRGLSPADLLAAQLAIPAVGAGVDGRVITRSTNAAIAERGSQGVPLIAGSNKDEGKFFTAVYEYLLGPDVQIPAESIARFVTGGEDPTGYLDGLTALHPDASAPEVVEQIWVDLFRRAAIGAVATATAEGAGGWLYQFDLQSTVPFLGHSVGAAHAAEISFTFNLYNTDDPGLAAFYDPEDPVVRDLAQRWSDTIIQFAKTGNPNGAGLPHWPRYDADARATLVLDAETRIEHDLNRAQRLLWDKD